MIKFTPLLDTLKLQKIDDSEYFSRKYKNYVSNSRLSLIDPNNDGSFESFIEGFKPTYSASFDLGSGVHELILQNNLFEVCYDVDKPTAKMGALADRLYPIFKETEFISDEDICKQATIIDYYGGNLNENKILNVRKKCESYLVSRKRFEESYTGNKELLYFDPKSRETVLKCVEALSNNKRVQNLLHPTGLFFDEITLKSEKVFVFLWENRLIPTKENIDKTIKELNIKIELEELEMFYEKINKLMQKQLKNEKKV